MKHKRLFISLILILTISATAFPVRSFAEEIPQTVELALSDQVVSMGGFPEEPDEDSILADPTGPETEVIDEVSGALENAVETRQKTVDLSDYEVGDLPSDAGNFHQKLNVIGNFAAPFT